MSTTETAIAKTPMLTGNRGLVLQDLDQMWRFAGAVVKSGLAPTSFKTPEAVMIAIQYGAEVGLSPMQSLQSLAVINGKPSLYGDALPGLAWASGLLEAFDEYIEGTGDKTVAVCSLKRRGVENPIVRRFSIEDAKKAGLWGKPGPWSSYQLRMLAMRARAFAFRDGFADVLRGLHISEEVSDYQQLPRDTIESTGFVIPTIEQPATIEQKPEYNPDLETVEIWKVTIGCATTPASLDKLYGEFQGGSERMADATVAAIEQLFEDQEAKIKTVGF